MRYQAFLSYSHKADSQLAAALHGALHRFAKPWYRLRALHIFRDTTNLAANPSLWSTIEQALGESEYFVLFASEEAAQSFWVQRELDYWLTHRPLDHLLIVLTDGELFWNRSLADFDWTRTTALPKMLAGKLRDEPLYLDLRWARTAEQLSLRHPKFRDAVADLAAPLHGRPKDELIGEDIRQYRRTWRLAAAAVMALALFAAAATVNGYLAVQERNEARRQQQVAEEQRDQSRRRLVQLNVNNGVRLSDDGDLSGALLWYAEAAKLGEGHAAEEPLLRERISATVRTHPLLEHVWFHDQAIRATDWLADNQHVVVFLDDGSARVWDVSTGQLAVPPLQRPDTVVTDARLVNGKVQALGVHDDDAILWEVAKGDPLAVLQHRGKVTAASFNEDGNRILTASEDGTARVWDVTGRQIISLRHPEGVAYAAFSSDASKVLTYTDNEAAVHLWNVSTAAEVTIELEAKPLLAEMSPDGRSTVTLDENKRALLWSTETGRRLSSLGDWEAVKLATFSPDGKHVALPTWYGWIIVWDLDTDKEGTSIQLKGGGPLAVSFSDDSKRVVTSSSDLTVRVWNVADGSPVTPPLWHDDFVHDALLSSDGTRLVTSGSEKGVVRVWQLTSAGPEQSRYEHEARSGDTGLNLATFSHDGSRLLTASDFVALVWNTTAAPSASPLRIEPGSQVYHAAFSPDGKQVVTCTEDGVAKLWDVQTGQVVKAFAHEDRVEDAAFTPDGTVLATASESQICVWDIVTQHQRACMSSNTGPVTHIQFDPHGKRLLALEFRGTVRVWDTETGQALPSFERQNAHYATYSPDGNWIATAERGTTVHVLNATTGAVSEPAIQLANRLKDMVFSPDGTRLLTADQDGTARVWTVASGTAIIPPLSPGGVIMSVAFSQDGTQVVTAGDDVRVWDAATGAPLTPPLKPPKGVRRVEFSPDGHRIVTAGYDGLVRVWDLSAPTETIDDLMHLCHAYAVRRLDDAGALVPLSTNAFRRDWQALHRAP
jgi:WD40 repeat protein